MAMSVFIICEEKDMRESTVSGLLSIAAYILVSIVVARQAIAGGLLGDAINLVAPGVGTALDDAHRQIKEAVPPYQAIEEGASHAVNESFVQAGAPALQELIARSRDDALQNGVQEIPEQIRQNLSGFIADDIMDVARYRVQGGGDLTLQVNAIRYGEAAAITLDYVIVFKEENDALYNPSLWAHELTHVSQYQSWGIHDFAVRYLRSYGDVENEAYQAETRYAAWTAVQNSSQFSSTGTSDNEQIFNRPIAPFGGAGASNICSTVVGTCQLNGSAPVGTPCWCNTAAGPATGGIVPQVAAFAPPAGGLPSGFGMLVCGCWGPFPPQVASEPRCASGSVRLNTCPGFCAPGHPAYAYVCM